MNNTLRLLSAVLTLVMLVSVLSSCSLLGIFKEETASNTTNNTETVSNDTVLDTSDVSNDPPQTSEPEITTPIVIENLTDYVLVRPDMASSAVKDAIMDLRETIVDKTGADLDLSTDYGAKSTYEILVGDLIRSESKAIMENLRSKDYIIKFDGSKIIIAGGCDDSLITAINKFKEIFIVDGKVLAPTGKGFTQFYDYVFEGISINGKPISEYKIYSANEACATKLSVKISEKLSGQIVEVTNKMSEKNGPFIVLEPTSMNYTHYEAKFKDGNLYISGSYKSCYEFFDYFVKKNSASVNITKGFEGDIDKPDLYTKEELMYVLETVYAEDGKLIIGQETNANIKTPYAGSVDVFFKATGEYPGIVGIDLSWAGLCLYKGARGQEKATNELKSQAFCEMVEYAEKGVIFTVGSHFLNPNPDGLVNVENSANNQHKGYLGNDKAFKDVIKYGTKLNKNFKAELDTNIEFLKACDDIGLALIWRPFHEMNTNFFWWCLDQKTPNGSIGISSQSFVNLWKYVYNKFDEAGLDNLLWHYCPDIAWNNNLSAYPGDDYCDIVGTDWYSRTYKDADGNLLGADVDKERIELLYYESWWLSPAEGPNAGIKYSPLGNLMTKNKPVGIGELGTMGDNKHDSSMDYVEDFREIFANGGKLAYALTWNGHGFDVFKDWKEALETGMFINCDELFNKYFPAAREALNSK